MQITKSGTEGFAKLFSLIEDKIVQEPARTCDFSAFSQCVIFTNNKGVREYVASHQEILTAPPESTIDRLMLVGETNEPDLVEPPITVLSVSPSGAEWLHQNNCADVRR